jgi:spore coat polysaccharide biosynthesis protein SpsF (cytidylyltransferase family)
MILAIVTVRMESSRISGKALVSFCGRPLMSWIVDRIRKSKTERIVLATPEHGQEELWRWADSEEIEVTRGPEEDVLQRMCQASREHGGTKLIRVTADLPFLSYEGLDAMIDALRPSVDYVNNFYGDHGWLDGTSAEMAWSDSLHLARRLTPFAEAHEIHKVHGGVEGSWRSHGMYWMANAPQFKRVFVDCPIDATGLPSLLVDDPADVRVAEFVMRKVIRRNDSYATLVEIVRENREEIERIRGQ